MKIAKALSKQLFGAKYESVGKSLLTAVILYTAVNAAELKLIVAPFILYLTSAFFTAGVMWQVLAGRRHLEAMQGMFMLPFENRIFVFSYVSVLGAHTLITKTLLLWTLFFAAASWSIFEIVAALLCGCMACAVISVFYLMFRKKNVLMPVLWTAAILFVILMVRQPAAVLIAALISMIGAVLYLYYADSYVFYNAAITKKAVRRISHTGNILSYLVRYLMVNTSYCINTLGLCGAACFLPLLLREFQGLNVLPLGLAILCLNTPVCTLLSCDSDLEQAIRVLPGQADRFCRKYCLFIFAVNGFVGCIYLCSWQLVGGGINVVDICTAILFALQSAILSVILEWIRPIRNWKTESDLWHHPRKYFVPLVMLLLAIVIGTWEIVIWLLAVGVLIECCVLLCITRRL